MSSYLITLMPKVIAIIAPDAVYKADYLSS